MISNTELRKIQAYSSDILGDNDCKLIHGTEAVVEDGLLTGACDSKAAGLKVVWFSANVATGTHPCCFGLRHRFQLKPVHFIACSKEHRDIIRRKDDPSSSFRQLEEYISCHDEVLKKEIATFNELIKSPEDTSLWRASTARKEKMTSCCGELRQLLHNDTSVRRKNLLDQTLEEEKNPVVIDHNTHPALISEGKNDDLLPVVYNSGILHPASITPSPLNEWVICRTKDNKGYRNVSSRQKGYVQLYYNVVIMFRSKFEEYSHIFRRIGPSDAVSISLHRHTIRSHVYPTKITKFTTKFRDWSRIVHVHIVVCVDNKIYADQVQ